MKILLDLPDYHSDEFGLFLSQLRIQGFKTQFEVAEYVGVSRGQIHRYENGDLNPPHSGYMACLMRRITELNSNTWQLQDVLLSLFNQAANDQYKKPDLQRWDQLCELANQYLDAQNIKFLFKAWSKNGTRKEVELTKRIGTPSNHSFVGMQEELDYLLHILTIPNSPWIVSIQGLGGIGKTSLAYALAQRAVQDNLFEDMGWVSVRRTDNFQHIVHKTDKTILDTTNLFEELLRQLMPQLPRNPATELPCPQNLLRQRFKELPHLIIIDNLETLSDLKTLLTELPSLANPTKFLLTSRVDIDLLDIYQMRLNGLNKEQALELMHNEASKSKITRITDADPELLQQIYRKIGGNPLALRVVVGQAKKRTIDDILARLDLLNNQSSGDVTRFIYQSVWENLQEQEQHLLLSLVLSRNHEVSVAYIAAINNLTPSQSLEILQNLEALNLIHGNQASTSRGLTYTIHSLTETYLYNLKNSSDAIESLYLMYLKGAIRYLLESQVQLDIFSPQEQAFYIHIIRLALHEDQLWQTVFELILAVGPKMEMSGVREEWIPILQDGIEVSQSRNAVSTEGELYFLLGTIRHRQSKYAEARQAFASSAKIFAELDDAKKHARVLNRSAYVARLETKLSLAEEQAKAALQLLEAPESLSKNWDEITYSYIVLGTVALDQREFEQAAKHFSYALETCPWNEDRLKAWCFTNLGTALRRLKAYDRAIDIYKQATKFLKGFNDPVHLAIAQMNLANIYMLQGDEQRSTDLYEEALTLYEPARKTFHQAEEMIHIAQIDTNMGIAYTKLNLWDKAETHLVESIQQYKRLAITPAVLNTMDSLGWLCLRQERIREGISIFREGLEIVETITDDPRYRSLTEMLTKSLKDAREILNEEG